MHGRPVDRGTHVVNVGVRTLTRTTGMVELFPLVDGKMKGSSTESCMNARSAEGQLCRDVRVMYGGGGFGGQASGSSPWR